MLVIDRFEGEYALIKMNKKIFHVPKTLIPKGAREGDVVVISINIDKKATEEVKEKNK
jgi:hypothetical protein